MRYDGFGIVEDIIGKFTYFDPICLN
jgi:hypothetical protein